MSTGLKGVSSLSHTTKVDVVAAGLSAQFRQLRPWLLSKELIRNLKNIVSNSFLTVTKTTMDALEAGCIKDSLTFLNMEFLKRRTTSSSTRVQVVAKLPKRLEIKRDT